MNIAKIKSKTGIIAVYVMALMLVGLGYWNYVSVESQKIQTVAETQEENNHDDENLGDAQLVNSNDVIIEDESFDEENVGTMNTESTHSTQVNAESGNNNSNSSYDEESKLQRDTMYSQTLETYKEMLKMNNLDGDSIYNIINTIDISMFRKINVKNIYSIYYIIFTIFIIFLATMSPTYFYLPLDV